MKERGFFSASNGIKTLDGNIFSGFPWLTTQLLGPNSQHLDMVPCCLCTGQITQKDLCTILSHSAIRNTITIDAAVSWA